MISYRLAPTASSGHGWPFVVVVGLILPTWLAVPLESGAVGWGNIVVRVPSGAFAVAPLEAATCRKCGRP